MKGCLSLPVRLDLVPPARSSSDSHTTAYARSTDASLNWMFSSLRNPRPRRILPALLTPLTLLAGCANPGPPHPPSLHLPALASGLTAERVGPDVQLTWNTPDKTSDGLAYSAPMTAIVCREPVPLLHRSIAGPACNQVVRLAVQPGQSHATDTLPPALQQDPPHLLAYQVELLNPNGRSAGISAQVLAAAGTAPPSPGPITITGSRKGPLIEWQALSSATPSIMQLTRTPATNTTTPVSHANAKKHAVGLPAVTTKDPASPVVLQTPAGPDPGGMLDSGALPQIPYLYSAQRVRTVILGGSPFELRSEASHPITFAYQEVFPPDPPSGLESIPNQPLSAPASIDLSWDASPTRAVTGYNVYRSDSPSASFARLTPAPIAGVSFRDLNVQPSRSYRYRVTAVDRAGNESAPSQEIVETIKTP